MNCPNCNAAMTVTDRLTSGSCIALLAADKPDVCIEYACDRCGDQHYEKETDMQQNHMVQPFADDDAVEIPTPSADEREWILGQLANKYRSEYDELCVEARADTLATATLRDIVSDEVPPALLRRQAS